MGARPIKAMGHVRMMAAAQPFLSGAISKTVNLPETATVEDIEDVYFQGWKLGLKALAVYRDNCKVGQPLSAGKGENKGAEATAAPAVEKVVEYRPTRKRLPKSRPSRTTSFTVGGAEGYMTAGSYPDDGLGEVFLKLGKQGSTLAGVMDAFSIAISVALQHGVPLETYVQKFTNMRFEPAGLTDDPDIRMAQSMVDYIFRRLALDYLDFDTRSALGIYTAEERTRQLDTGSYTPADDGASEEDLESLAQSAPVTKPATDVVDESDAAELPAPAGVHSSTELLESAARQLGRRAAVHELRHQDAPGRQLLRLRRLRQHQRLQLSFRQWVVPASSAPCRRSRDTRSGRPCARADEDEAGRFAQSLTDDAVPLHRCGQPFQRGVVGVAIDRDRDDDVPDADRDLTIYAQRAPGIEAALGPQRRRTHLDAEGGRHTAQRHARARQQRLQQHVAGAGVVAVAAGGGVQTRPYRSGPAVDGAGDSGIAVVGPGAQRGSGTGGIGSVARFERSL